MSWFVAENLFVQLLAMSCRAVSQWLERRSLAGGLTLIYA